MISLFQYGIEHSIKLAFPLEKLLKIKVECHSNLTQPTLLQHNAEIIFNMTLNCPCVSVTFTASKSKDE
jgi:hypothetical protein